MAEEITPYSICIEPGGGPFFFCFSFSFPKKIKKPPHSEEGRESREYERKREGKRIDEMKGKKTAGLQQYKAQKHLPTTNGPEYRSSPACLCSLSFLFPGVKGGEYLA